MPYLVEFFVFGDCRDARHEEYTAFDLVLMRMPELLLLIWQALEQLLRDDVLDPNQTGVLLGAVVDQTLAHILVVVRAVMVCFYLPSHIMCIEVKPATTLFVRKTEGNIKHEVR